jgi:hypothetical protein
MAATTVVPRWEWRCFAPSLALLERAVAIPSDVVPRDSDEIYILDPTAPVTENVKIRDGVLDIKRLGQTDADGLELWEPVFKARFPLGRGDVAAAFAGWTPPLAALSRESYSIEQLIGDVIAPRPALRVARVHKSRRSFAFADCPAELVRLTVESIPVQSFSLEHEDPQRILAALRKLGLDGHANTSYPLGLERALGVARAKG